MAQCIRIFFYFSPAESMLLMIVFLEHVTVHSSLYNPFLYHFYKHIFHLSCLLRENSIYLFLFNVPGIVRNCRFPHNTGCCTQHYRTCPRIALKGLFNFQHFFSVQLVSYSSPEISTFSNYFPFSMCDCFYNIGVIFHLLKQL
ncbi:hypothetical protein XELAEV_18011582mg [Xenopus laevis]|uniref:Uncharacterized protein n=1 Tax=Xenopus laevis TaxID=8355 RepID=A0A974HXF9_XENLA|nr:hypothetical protein XELAEV_18011582mg [Xenopus laevis]